jgi:hypothetical protein
MSTSVSFFELRLEAGDLQAVLGSGQCEDVLARDLSQPFIRICMRDSKNVSCRVRCGTVELTERGLDYSRWDDFQTRGASIRLFAWSTSVARQIGAQSEAVRRLLSESSSSWLEFSGGLLSAIEESQARRALSTSDPIDENRVYIQLQVPPARAEEILSILRRDSSFDAVADID